MSLSAWRCLRPRCSQLVSLASYHPPTRRGTHGRVTSGTGFAGRWARSCRSCRFSSSAYAAHVIPLVLVVIPVGTTSGAESGCGWQIQGGAARCSSCIGTILSMAFGIGSISAASRSCNGGYLGQWLSARDARISEPHRFDHRALLARRLCHDRLDAVLVWPRVSNILRRRRQSRQRSVDQPAVAREERQREKQRRDVIAKHTKKAAIDPSQAKAISEVGEGGPSPRGEGPGMNRTTSRTSPQRALRPGNRAALVADATRLRRRPCR